jgi:BASS family bile acid:Na+ symporter
MNTVFIVLPILTLLMFSLGLSLSIEDFKLLFSRPKSVLIGLCGQLVLLPVVAFILSVLFIVGKRKKYKYFYIKQAL